jgi:hypothetical protein
VQHLRDVIAAVVGNDAVLHDLRHDPSAFARALNLSSEHVAALRSADRFFETEKPIPDPPPTAGVVTPRPPASVRAFLQAPPPATGLTVTADSGTLLPGPTTGTYTIISSATATEVGTRPPAPAAPTAPAGKPSVPGVPFTPQLPSTPSAPVTPRQPAVPVVPVVPSAPQVPAAPTGQPGPCPQVPQPVQIGFGAHSGCETAIVAIVANVSTTANTAIAAITAIAQRRQHAEPARPASV